MPKWVPIEAENHLQWYIAAGPEKESSPEKNGLQLLESGIFFLVVTNKSARRIQQQNKSTKQKFTKQIRTK